MANKALAFVGILGVIAILPVGIPAQMCPGSHIVYVVRDAQGSPVELHTVLDAQRRPVDVQSAAFTLTVSGGGVKWMARNLSGYVDLLPPGATALREGNISALDMYPAPPPFCTFEKPVELNVTGSGRTMLLTFLTPPMPGNTSRNFIVDGLPFQEGRFEITLPYPPSQSSFYPATGWAKK